MKSNETFHVGHPILMRTYTGCALHCGDGDDEGEHDR